MELGLQNRQVLVTGGTRGIGLAIVQAFLNEGAVVHVLARNVADQLNGELAMSNPGKLFYYSCDVADTAALQATIAEMHKNGISALDILVANAGSGTSVPIAIPEEAHWNQVWNTNFNSALHTIRTFQSYLSKQNASVVFISSIAGVEYLGAPTDYSVAKAALNALAKNLAHKLAPIRVNAVAPGNIFFEGGSWDRRVKEKPDKINTYIQEKVPLKRFGKPEEIADLVVFLSSEKAAFITGTCVVADGGQTNTF